MKYRTEKQIKRRKEERKGLPDFYKHHISISKNRKCENCGLKIKNPGTKNIAHIIPKSRFKSVNDNLDNYLFLCSNFDRFDGKMGCHERYDKSWSSAMSMPVWKLAVERFNKFKHLIVEKSRILEYFNYDKK